MMVTNIPSTFLLVAALLVQAPAQNLVQNGAFDRDLSGWTLGSGEWALDEVSDSGAAKVLNPPYRFRSHARGIGTVVFGIWQCIAIDKTRNYELRMHSRISRDFEKVGYGEAALTWFSNVDCSVRPNPRRSGIVGFPVSIKLANSDGNWHELALTNVHPPANARSVEIALESAVLNLEDKRTIEVWFDNIIFRAVNR